jgi:hypothetical protein
LDAQTLNSLLLLDRRIDDRAIDVVDMRLEGIDEYTLVGWTEAGRKRAYCRSMQGGRCYGYADFTRLWLDQGPVGIDEKCQDAARNVNAGGDIEG